MNRAEQYKKFNRMVAELLIFCDKSNIPIKILECWRSPQAASINASNGVGVINSKHIYSLAIDIAITSNDGLSVLYADDRYKLIADFWKSQGGKAGYDFKTANYSDIYHLELNELPYKKK